MHSLFQKARAQIAKSNNLYIRNLNVRGIHIRTVFMPNTTSIVPSKAILSLTGTGQHGKSMLSPVTLSLMDYVLV